MDQQQRQLLSRYTNLILRKKKIIIFFLYLAIVGGLVKYVKTPKIYQSTALIIYQRASINPGSQMTPDIKSRTQELVATLTQQVTSRTSLESLIKQLDLYKGLRQNIPMEDVVDIMRSSHIYIAPDRGDVFKVSYQGGNPELVKQVTNALAARFIEENLRYREEKVTETSAYVEDELNIAKSGLDKKEALMRDYKLKYYNEMPQQLQVNMTRLNALQTQLQNNQNNRQDLERTIILIQEQVSLRKETLTQMAVQVNTLRMQSSDILHSQIALQQTETNPALAASLNQLAALQKQLEDLLARYTEKHPAVKRLQKRLQGAEESHAKLVASMGNPTENTGEESTAKTQTDNNESPNSRLRDAQLDQLELQLKESNLNITRIKKERKAIEKQIIEYKKWIEMTPVREAEWSALTRNYDQLYNHYERLVTRNLEADSAQSLERRQKGSQFKIVDSAYYPEKPFKPDFKKIMLFAMGVGLGLGGACAFLLEIFDTSFRDVLELEKYVDVPVICSIPVITTAKEKKIALIKVIAWWIIFLVSTGGIIGFFLFLMKTGRIII